MTLNRRNLFSFGAATAVLATAGETASASPDVQAPSLPGFRSGYAKVNGIRMHYVTGGRGRPLVLVPGWPQTWWEFRKIMPELARRYRVIAVDGILRKVRRGVGPLLELLDDPGELPDR